MFAQQFSATDSMWLRQGHGPRPAVFAVPMPTVLFVCLVACRRPCLCVCVCVCVLRWEVVEWGWLLPLASRQHRLPCSAPADSPGAHHLQVQARGGSHYYGSKEEQSMGTNGMLRGSPLRFECFEGRWC